MIPETIKARVKTVRGRLRELRIASLLVTAKANVSYITGFSGDDSWALVAERSVYLITDSRYTEQAAAECPACRIVQRKGPIARAAADIIGRLKTEGAAAVEKSVSVAEYDALKKHIKRRIKTIGGIVEQVRQIKDPQEIAAIEKAARIAAQALEALRPYVKTGISESDLAGALDFEIRKLGATNSFDTIAAFGPNASRPHHQPGKKKLKKNDSVLIDFGAKYNGYCCDITRCFAVGKSSKLYRRVHAAVEEAQAAAIDAARPGARLTEVDAAAREVIKAHNLPVYGHGTGHGLGLEVHEAPTVAPKQRGRLRPGHIITIEPAVYIPGKLGIRIEDDSLITQTGCQTLTKNCPHDFW